MKKYTEMTKEELMQEKTALEAEYEKIKNLDCVSFGPDNFDIHTPKERLSISSTGRVWDFIVEFLKQAK